MTIISSLCTMKACVGMDVAMKSSLSGGINCVQVGAAGKSSLSNMNGSCVQVGAAGKSSLSNMNGSCVQVGAAGKSSLSNMNGSCVQVGAAFESSLSNLNGNCVQADAKSSSLSSYNGDCVEVSAGDDHADAVILITDTKHPDDPAVEFTPAAWQEFVDRVASGEFPVCDGVDEYRIGHHVYNRDEWAAFVGGSVLPCKQHDDCGLREFDVSRELLPA